MLYTLDLDSFEDLFLIDADLTSESEFKQMTVVNQTVIDFFDGGDIFDAMDAFSDASIDPRLFLDNAIELLDFSLNATNIQSIKLESDLLFPSNN